MRKPSPATQACLDALSPDERKALDFIPILARDGVVAVLDGPLTARRVAFRLHKVGIAIVVRSPDGEHLGTFAGPNQAALCGFDYFEREAERHRAAQPRRAKRRPLKERQP